LWFGVLAASSKTKTNVPKQDPSDMEHNTAKEGTSFMELAAAMSPALCAN
jgi:hypothetical protein